MNRRKPYGHTSIESSSTSDTLPAKRSYNQANKPTTDKGKVSKEPLQAIEKDNAHVIKKSRQESTVSPIGSSLRLQVPQNTRPFPHQTLIHLHLYHLRPLRFAFPLFLNKSLRAHTRFRHQTLIQVHWYHLRPLQIALPLSLIYLPTTAILQLVRRQMLTMD